MYASYVESRKKEEGGNMSQEERSKKNPIEYGHKCMVGRHLTPEMYDRLKHKKTSKGVTFDQVVHKNRNAGEGIMLGLRAGDEESYDVFGEIFDDVIDEYHLGFGKKDKQPAPDLEPSKVKDTILDEKYVRSCRIRTGRGLKGYRFTPCVSIDERRKVEELMVDALAGLSGELAGKYYPLSKMTGAEEKQLIDDHFLFCKTVETGLNHDWGMVRDWPDARGIWHNNNKTFLVWINEEDHVRMISMQKGGNMKATFERFCTALQLVDKQIAGKGSGFMLHPRFGWLCTCPSNIGTAMRCSVHIQLHKLCKHPQFGDIVKALQLQKRGTGGEETGAVDDVYDISNVARLKKTESEFVQLVIDGVEKLIEMEKRLEMDESIDDLLPADMKGAKK